jgi:5'-methylthioinosine phosphorylase
MTARTHAGDRRYALIAGSGFAGFGTEESREQPIRRVLTRFGAPSAPIRTANYGDHRVLMLARHGDDIGIAPHRINYRANLAALQMLGASTVIALNTVGVIPSRLYPGNLAVPAQILDYTWGRAHTIYDDERKVDHIDVTEPFSADLRLALVAAAREAEVECHDGGVYGVTQGPRLESTAEVNRFERDGVDFLGMTAMPEASLARELGLNYACLSLLVNRAAGRGEVAIHADIEACTLSAKLQAMRVLKRLFAMET